MTIVHPTPTEAGQLPGADPKIPAPPSTRAAPSGRVVKAVRSVAWASVGGAVIVALWLSLIHI